MYYLMTVLTLLDVSGLPSSSTFAGILRTRQLYLKFFQRKLKAAECSFVDYATFRRTLEKVKALTDLLESLFALA